MPTLDLNKALEKKQLCTDLAKRAGVELSDCYQCGKCSAGCPMGEGMDILPRQIIALLKVGEYDTALNAVSPWVCVGCHTCECRCPHGIRIDELMETVRHTAAKNGICPRRDAKKFSNYFMIPVRLFGRSHEMIMSAFYNILSGHFFLNFSHIPKMLKTGKLGIIPHWSGDIKDVNRIIKNCEEEAKK